MADLSAVLSSRTFGSVSLAGVPGGYVQGCGAPGVLGVRCLARRRPN